MLCNWANWVLHADKAEKTNIRLAKTDVWQVATLWFHIWLEVRGYVCDLFIVIQLHDYILDTHLCAFSVAVLIYHRLVTWYKAVISENYLLELRPIPYFLRMGQNIWMGRYSINGIESKTTIVTIIHLSTKPWHAVAAMPLIVSCPDPTQPTRGEGVWCHKSNSLG